MNYPFEPRTTAYLESGQYWAIPLSNGRYACGVVIAKLADMHDGKIRQRTFLGALIDWVGDEPPDEESIRNASVLKSGEAHLKAIHTTGGTILGKSSILCLGENPRVKTDDVVTMGYGVLKKVAESKFGQNS